LGARNQLLPFIWLQYQRRAMSGPGHSSLLRFRDLTKGCHGYVPREGLYVNIF